MGRESRSGYDDYEEYDSYDRSGSARGQRAGGSRGRSARDVMTPPSHYGAGSDPSRAGSNPRRGDGRSPSDPRAGSRGGSGPRSAREEDARRRSSRRDDRSYDEGAHVERAPRTLGGMARDFSRQVSRQLGAMVHGTERAVQHSVAPRSEYRPAFSASNLEDLAEDAQSSPYRRSRIRLRARKWRVKRTPANPLKLAIILGTLATVLVLVLGAGGAGTVYAVNYYNQHLTQIQALAANLQNSQSSIIYDRNGQVLYTVKGQNSNYNIYTPLAQINPLVREATIDTEDPTFYSKLNIGIDFKSVLRASAADAQAGGAAQGASTITQQLVKNMVLEDQTKAIQRKVNEAILAVGLTLNYTKDQILEMYLNSIDYGNLNEGVEAAARNYFGVIPKPDGHGGETLANQQLDLAEAALLAGLPNAPTYYLPTQYSCKTTCPDSKWNNPCTNTPTDSGCDPNPNYCAVDYDGCPVYDGHEWLVWRRARYVLQKMVTQGDINQGQADSALQEVHDLLLNHKLYVSAGTANGNVVDTTKNAPHFIDYLLNDVLPKQFGIDNDILPHAGLKIYTTLDLNLDTYAQQRLKYYIQGDSSGNFTNYWYCGSPQPPTGGCQAPALGNAWNVHNGSVVAIDPHTGDILAMVGSVDYGSTNKQVLGFNNIATSIYRSMGSSTKALIYATAFQKGWTPATILQDKTICYPFPADSPTTVTNKYAPACKGWYSPTNYETASFSGPAPVRPMLANSLNIPATEAMSFVGDGAADTTSDDFLAMVQRLGVTTLSKGRMGPATALGAQEIPLLQLTGAYASFADAGMRHPYRSILRIEDSAGTVLYQAPSVPQGQQVLSPEAAYMLTSILTDNQARLPDFGWYNPLFFGNQYQLGQGSKLNYPNLQIAAKTGTSQGNGGPNDIVTMGYSPYLSLGVWFGNTDPNDPLTPGIIGIAGAGYVFHDVMQWAITNYKWPTDSQFPIPADMARGQFNCTSGLAPYKDQKLAPCKLTPQFKTGATNLFAGLNTSQGPQGYGGGDTMLNQDWYVQGQAPLQS
jgi:membrane peptidoglycan carboxypeptidase